MNVGLAFTSWGRKLGRSLLKLKKTPKNCFETNRWNIVKGDLVEVVQGPQTGQRGKVLDVIRETNRIIVDNVNMVSWRCFNGFLFFVQNLIVVCRKYCSYCREQDT